jgi:hypothetical protein
MARSEFEPATPVFGPCVQDLAATVIGITNKILKCKKCHPDEILGCRDSDDGKQSFML